MKGIIKDDIFLNDTAKEYLLHEHINRKEILDFDFYPYLSYPYHNKKYNIACRKQEILFL